MIDEICEGIAANLHALRELDPPLLKQVHPFLLENPTAPSAMVGDPIEFTFESFTGPDDAGTVRWLIPVEVWLGTASDIGSRKRLRQLLAPAGASSLVAAVEAAGDLSRRRLTSRLNEEGELSTDQAPACDSIAFEEFRGSSRFLADNGTTYLLATWIFEVVTSDE